MANFFITSTLRKRLDKSKQPVFKNHLKTKLAAGAYIIGSHEIRNGYVIEKKRSTSGPRFIWRIVKRGEKILYVLRDFYLHDWYTRRYNTGTVERWNTMTEFSPEENKEIDIAFTRLI